MNVDGVFADSKPGCRLVIDQGLPPWDQVAGRSYAGKLNVILGDRLSGALWDEWEMVLWKQSVSTVHQWLSTRSTRQQGSESGEGQEALDPLGVLEAGGAVGGGLLHPFPSAPPARLQIVVTHSDDPVFNVRKIDDGATLEFVHDPHQPVQDLGQALVYESGNVGGTFLRPILIAQFAPVWAN
jgi:hypothetical protein